MWSIQSLSHHTDEKKKEQCADKKVMDGEWQKVTEMLMARAQKSFW